MSAEPVSEQSAWCRSASDGAVLRVEAGGAWTLSSIETLQTELAKLESNAQKAARIDLAALSALDAAGAWILHRFMRRLEGRGSKVELAGVTPAQQALLARMAAADQRQSLIRDDMSPIRAMVERLGHGTIQVGNEAYELIAFYGQIISSTWRGVSGRRRLRPISVFSHVERIGLDALPIVGLLCFLIGVVLSYQGADQLKQFGAEIFSVNLLGLSVFREIGVLITSIIVAGRSGSAFTAEIGIMKINEEVDAMRTLGLDPLDVLVMPRLVAMMIALPLLTFYGDVMAIAGGAMISVLVLDLSLTQFLDQLRSAVSATSIWVGLVKAPVFAFIIALVGTYDGLKVEGSAESVGLMTTKSVVQSIFLVIVFDALFSIVFSYFGI
jgi:phospholipid/cholesterol/gamma-HCH transport system permease protein